MIGRMALTAAALCLVAVFLWGCGGGNGEEGGGGPAGWGNGKDTVQVDDSDHELGQVEGYEDGFSHGYRDGKEEAYDPEPDIDPAWSDKYAAGYEEGYREGYDEGYDEALAREGSEAEEVKEAMLAFVEANSAPGLRFELKDLVINGDEAAATAICVNEDLEPALVVMKKGPAGWYGVDFGTGIEAPSWYEPG